MANDLQRIYDEVSVTVKSSRARDQSDVLNTTGSVLQFIIDSFGDAWPIWLMNTDTFTQTTQTKDLSAAFTPSLYSNKIKDIWIANIGRIDGPFDVGSFDPMLSTYPTGLPSYWGWAGYQTIQFDVIPNGYTISCRYQEDATTINSSSTITNTPDIPGNDGYNLLLVGVKAMLKLDTTAVDTLVQVQEFQSIWNQFYDRYAVEDSAMVNITYR